MRILLIILSFLVFYQLEGQNNEKDFNKLYYKVAQKNIPKNLSKEDSSQVAEIKDLLFFYKEFLDEELKFNGKTGFKFNGNQNGINDLLDIGINGSIDKGAYPYEFDFSMDFKRTTVNEQVNQNVSNFDISFDFHPIESTKKDRIGYSDNGLWLENFVLAKHFTNDYLGIKSRIEVGAGFIFNFFSGDLFNRRNNNKNTEKKEIRKNPEITSNKNTSKKNKEKLKREKKKVIKGFTEKGLANFDSLQRKPHYKHQNQSFFRCLEKCYKARNFLEIDNKETYAITKSRDRFQRANIKNNSKLRLALLLGIYYEIEDTKAENRLFNGEKDTLVSQDFSLTTRLRWEIRPTIVWQPRDKYKFKLYPYFKLPFGDTKTEVAGVEKYDYFIDLLASFDIKVEESFQVSLFYRLYYDHTPKSIELQGFETPFLVGRKTHNNFGVSLNYSF